MGLAIGIHHQHGAVGKAQRADAVNTVLRRAGELIGDNTDEVPSRGIWRHYRATMEAA